MKMAEGSDEKGRAELGKTLSSGHLMVCYSKRYEGETWMVLPFVHHPIAITFSMRNREWMGKK
jgi:hypothetical protein